MEYIDLKEKIPKRKWQKRYAWIAKQGDYIVYNDKHKNQIVFCLGTKVLMRVDEMQFDIHDHFFGGPEHQPHVKILQEEWAKPGVRQDYMKRGYRIQVVDANGRVRMSM